MTDAQDHSETEIPGGDIDFEKSTLYVKWALAENYGHVVNEPKSKHSKRAMSLPPFVLHALRQPPEAARRVNVTGPVFCPKGGHIRKSSTIRQAWTKLAVTSVSNRRVAK